MAAKLLTRSSILPNLDYPIIDYLSSLFTTPEPEFDDNPIECFVIPLLESEGIDTGIPEMAEIIKTLQEMWEEHCGASRLVDRQAPTRLEKILDMKRQEALSKQSASMLALPAALFSKLT
jgi:ATP-binding cassette subfamily F protein 3